MPNRCSLMWFLTVVILALFRCGYAPAADPKPSLADLLTEYKNLGLPLPSPEASLVSQESGAEVRILGVLQPKKITLAFEIRPVGKTDKLLLLQGIRELRVFQSDKIVKVKPETVTLDNLDLEPDAALGLAIQCHARGWNSLAQALLLRSRPLEGIATPTERLVSLAWEYWLEQLSHPTADRAPVAKRMKELMQRDPDLDTKPNRKLLASLELALIPGKGKPGSMESLVDALVDYHDGSGVIVEHKSADAYRRISEMGFDAVPALIAALGDDRLTRSMCIGFNNFPSKNLRVGDIAGNLLEGLAVEELDRGFGRKGKIYTLLGYRVTAEAAKEWWSKAEKIGEEKYLLDKVLPPTDKDVQTLWPEAIPLRVIEVKYPKRLPELYRTVLDKRPDIQSSPLAEAIARSSLPLKDKLELFELASKHKTRDHRMPAVRALKQLSPN